MQTVEKREMSKGIKNLLLSDKYPDDRECLDLINELRIVVRGARPKDLFRNFILVRLPDHIAQLRKNGGQLAGSQT